MALYSSPKVSAPYTVLTEFDILKASHKFLRDEEETESSERKATKSWNEQLAEKYYANLYREFAVCDLKHYKSGNFALRWRTEDEVLSGAGETTCANTRCEHHHPTSSPVPPPPLSHTASSGPKVPLSTLELPFAYEEHGEQKSALVKVVLCDRCVRKLMYKRTKEKEKAMKMERERERAARGDDDNDDGDGSKEIRKRKKGKSKEVVAEGSATGEDKGRGGKRSQRQEDHNSHSSQSYERDARHRRSSHRSRSAQDGHANFTP